MSGKAVDYDQLAPTYDRRFRDDGVRGTAVALLELARGLAAQRILEVGCGTGRWLHDLKPASDHLYGLDLSIGMLERARSRDGALRLVRGQAGRLPFPPAAFDLVYCVNAIHHFDAQREFVSEAQRLLRPGGALAVLGMDPHGRRDSWYVYGFFADTYETDLVRFPAWGTILDWAIEAGFEAVSWRVVERIKDPKVGWAVLDDPFLKKDACSQLALLSDEEYAVGLQQIRRALEAAEASNQELVFDSNIQLGMLCARKV
jgi:ubiquinone/menaquinone biosynthesis C-methylase UbiE